MVDTMKMNTKTKYSTRLRPFSARVGRPHRSNWQQQQDADKDKATNPHIRPKGQQKLNKRWDRLSNARRMYHTRRREDKRTDRKASVIIDTEWKVMEQFDLSQLLKLQTTFPEAEDLKWCGEKRQYEEAFDRVSTRSSVPLQRFADRDFFYVSTTDDPVVEEMAIDGVANVFATDAILAQMMTCPRSVYPWDIVVQRVGNALFFDKRDDSKFDLLTVDETAYDTPPEDNPDSINHPDKLSVEATMINQNYTQQILKSDTAEPLDHPNPFLESEERLQPASVAYRYRKFALGNDVNLVVRCEINGELVKRGGEKE